MSQRHVPNTFVFKQLASLRKLEELAMKFEQAQINRKLAQATASHRKLAVKRGTTVHKLKTCDDLRSHSNMPCHLGSGYLYAIHTATVICHPYGILLSMDKSLME